MRNIFKKNDHDNTDKVSARRRFWIALWILIAGFVLLAAMLFIQAMTSHAAVNSLTVISNGTGINQTVIAEAAKIYEDINKTNQIVFNIILPVISALMGTVVAFYYGSDNLAKAQETIEKALSPEEKLSKKTIEELMKNQSETTKVRTATMEEKIKEIKEKAESFTNVLVVDDNTKPLGVLYKWELKEAWDEKQLKDKITDIEDYITKKKWTIEGIKNFAVLSKYDNLLGAKKRMDIIAPSVEQKLSVRGVVVDEDEKVIGIINFANISGELM